MRYRPSGVACHRSGQGVEIRPETWDAIRTATKKHPTKRRPLESAAGSIALSFAAAFLLREDELCCLTLDEECVSIDPVNGWVTLHLLASKVDPCGRGVKRTRVWTRGLVRKGCPSSSYCSARRFGPGGARKVERRKVSETPHLPVRAQTHNFLVRTSQCAIHSLIGTLPMLSHRHWLKYKGSVSRISQEHRHLFALSLIGVSSIRFPPVASSLTCSLSRPSASLTSLERTRFKPWSLCSLEWNVWLLAQSDSKHRYFLSPLAKHSS